jgi:hypothetical protein
MNPQAHEGPNADHHDLAPSSDYSRDREMRSMAYRLPTSRVFGITGSPHHGPRAFFSRQFIGPRRRYR